MKPRSRGTEGKEMQMGGREGQGGEEIGRSERPELWGDKKGSQIFMGGSLLHSLRG